MTDYRFVMLLLMQQWSFRQIAQRARCSHATIAKAKQICEDHGFTTVADIEQLTAEDLELLFLDGRKTVSDEFVGFDLARMVKRRTGIAKAPLKVLWARYLETEAAPGQRHYSYQRFCQIVGQYVDVNQLTMRIQHVPAHTMQVDWAGQKMVVFDPITGAKTRVSIFVASLPYSGLVFAYGYGNERQPNWLDGHKRAFEYAGGVTQVVIPDNTSTASNQITKGDRAREVNQAYEEFLAYYTTAAVPTNPNAPQEKGNVEAGVKVVTHEIIQFLADRRFASLDELNAAIGQRVDFINARTPFRGNQEVSRQDLFEEHERHALLHLPEQQWQPVVWRKSKVNRDYHIEIATVKYSVPYAYAGQSVDVRIIGDQLAVMANNQIIAHPAVPDAKHVFITDVDHAPAHHRAASGLWTGAYFVRQAHKIGPATVEAIKQVLHRQRIEAQGYRTCQNILHLAKGSTEKKRLLEQACHELIVQDTGRLISYTSVKQQLAALRALATDRPTTGAARSNQRSATPLVTEPRDTRGAHLAGPDRFSLDALLQHRKDDQQDGGQR
ncbi:MAG: IS21 family transposase [Micrococcaceae bacterium]|nr:IS21 family transposase [Micrococcaceae bacterium]